MNSTADFSLNHAFVLDSPVSSKIWSLLTSKVGTVYASAACEDGLVRRFETPEELHKYENPLNRAIYAISFLASSPTRDAWAEVSFNWSYGGRIRVQIDGSEAVVLDVRDRIHDILAGTRPWYWRISRFDASPIFLLIAFALIWFIGVTSSGKSKAEAISLKEALLGTIALLTLIVFYSLVPWCLNKIRRRYFPHAVFAFGQAKARYETDEKVRWGVIVAFVLSLIASIVAAFLIRGV